MSRIPSRDRPLDRPYGSTNGSRSLLAIFAVFLGLLSACAQPLLNSERIERQFGSYGVEILQSSESLRLSNLFSGTGTDRICRTLALVEFVTPRNDTVAAEHEQIVAGGSIGAVFKRNGWVISKVNIELGSVVAPIGAELIANLMAIQLPVELALHAYRFELQRGNEYVHYATIIELHHPDYLSTERLQHLYGNLPSDVLSAMDQAAIHARVQQSILP